MSDNDMSPEARRMRGEIAELKARIRMFMEQGNRHRSEMDWAYQRGFAEGLLSAPNQPGSVVYIADISDETFKVGYTTRIRERMTAIHARRVLAVVAGGKTMESSLHEEIAEHRAHGEYFYKNDATLAWVNKIDSMSDIELDPTTWTFKSRVPKTTAA